MQKHTRIDMEDFKSILNQEIQLYSAIENSLDEKKDIIIKGDLDRLAQIDNELEKLSERAHDLEKERLSTMVRMGKEGDTLNEFISSLQSGEDTIMLEHAREQLIKTTESIKQLSKTNRDLLTQSIHFIEQSVNVIASILSPNGASYGPHPTKRSELPDIRIDKAYHNTASTISREA